MVFLERSVVTQLVKKFPAFLKPKVLLSLSQKIIIENDPEPL
jgi:hypothetical protein